MNIEMTLRFIGEALLASGVVCGLFTLLGKGWIENQFAKRLKAYEREQQEILEQYRHQINSLFNRITKIHEKEIEVLPNAWQKLQNAHGHLARLIQPFRIDREITQMNEEQYKEYRREYEEISNHFMDFHNYLLNNNIFLSPDLYAQFKAVDELFHNALIKSNIAKQGLSRSEFTMEVFENIYNKAEPIKEKIRELVQKRLRYQEAE
jgi:hypothetical protein